MTRGLTVTSGESTITVSTTDMIKIILERVTREFALSADAECFVLKEAKAKIKEQILAVEKAKNTYRQSVEKEKEKKQNAARKISEIAIKKSLKKFIKTSKTAVPECGDFFVLHEANGFNWRITARFVGSTCKDKEESKDPKIAGFDEKLEDLNTSVYELDKRIRNTLSPLDEKIVNRIALDAVVLAMANKETVNTEEILDKATASTLNTLSDRAKTGYGVRQTR